MFKQMNVNAAAIGESAQQILSTGDALAGEVAAFRGQVDALADAFGGDDLGSALATIYQVVSEAAFESFTDNAEGLSEVGRTLQAMADDYSTAETANSDSFRQLMGGLG
ncbi:WXG100 family type VII secretion target [Saccharothrix coeruleofusca]|uniref:Excreted virulence factor EspC (Type VII ESX diderm) n=1 Tax=Saccharothrix coeruleofusca TaxID=33919 RepID=A0A918ANW7_9PSEU|nr:hypothetical protein [Saccharothrix coeruleofusca]MBP2336601.1 uncharacterized protein YukE [Saccharothrix coeruleofusca]GGP51837.1 hypothetical protein GCM10010185_24870 [Saccharothrix coeruleofusca]